MRCPKRQELERFLAGELEIAAANALTMHVEGCAACQSLLDELAASEPAPLHSDLLRGPSEGDLEPTEEFLDHLSRSLPNTSGLYPSSGLPPESNTVGLRSAARENPVPPTVPGYEIVGELSRGGMGVVYKARQVGLNRLVALKMILSGVHASAGDRARLRAEAEAVARLQHPNIVQIYDIGEHEGRPYFSMELIDGPTLAQACQGQPQPPRLAAALVETVARAIQCAHQQGILHRDLKPSNVLLANEDGGSKTSEGRAAGPSSSLPLSVFSPKVIDFGLVRRLDDVRLTQQGMIVGTPIYMAPEQVVGRRREASSAIDIYALGAILFELLTGRPPFTGETTMDILLQVQNNDPISVMRLHPGTPLDLATVTMKCLEKDPRRRYASAAALADDLARFREGRPVRARPLGPFGRAWRWCRRNPAVAGLLTVLALVFLAGFGATLWQLREARSNAEAEAIARGDAEYQKDLAQQREREANDQRRRAEQGETASQLDQALSRCRQNDLATGLLLLADCLTKAEQAGADDLLYSIRCNLTAWSRQWIEIPAAPPQGSPLLCAAWAPDGRLAAFGPLGDSQHKGGLAEVRFWDSATWQPIGKPMPHPLAVWGLAFSPDGKTLLTGCGSSVLEDANTKGEARLWDVPSGTAVGPPLPHPAGVQAVAFRRDGKIFATGCRDGAVRLWEAASRRPLGQLLRPATGEKPLAPVTAVAFSRDGKTVLAAASRSVHSWNVTDGTPRGTFPHAAQVTALAVSPDGSQVLTGCDDHTAHLWDAVAGRLLGPPMPAPATIWSVAFHPSKPLLATGSGRPSLWQLEQQHGRGALQLWDVTTLKPVGPTLIEQVGWVHAAAFSPDGRHIVAATGDGRPHHADVSRVFPLAQTLRHAPQVRWVRYSPDGQSLLTVATSGRSEPPEGEIRLWEAATGRPIGGPMPARTEGSHGFFQIFFNSDGKTLRNFLGREFWLARDAATGALLGPPLPEKEPAGYPLELSPDGKQFYVLRNGAVLLWNVAANRQIGPPLTHEGGITAAAFHPNGKTLLTAGGDGTTRRWDLATHRPLGAPVHHPSPVQLLAFTPDGRMFVTADREDRLRRWDTESGHSIDPAWHVPDKKSRERYYTMSFTPDGRYLAVDSHEVLRLWETAAGRLVLSVPNFGHAWAANGKWLALVAGDVHESSPWGAVSIWDGERRQRRDLAETSTLYLCLDFHPNNRILAASWDQAAGLWDTAAGKPIGPPLEHPGTVFALHFSPDGSRLATCSVDDMVRIWDVPRPVAGGREKIRLWIEVLTGHELNDAGKAQPLPTEEREKRRGRLAELGGPPVP